MNVLKNLKIVGKSTSVALAASTLMFACDSDGPPRVEDPNDPPFAVQDTFEVQENTVLADAVLQGIDPDGDEITFRITQNPANGTVTIDDPNTCGQNSRCGFDYTPTAGFTGTDEFRFLVNDGREDSNVGIIRIVVSPAAGNNPPQILNQTFDVREDGFLQTAQIVASDPDGQAITFAVVPGSGPTNGTLINFDGNLGQFSYRPNRDFVGEDNFVVRVTDTQGANEVASMILNVTCDDPNGQTGQCGYDKLPLVDAGGVNARAPSIAVDTAIRPAVAFIQDNTNALGGTDADLFVVRLSGNSWPIVGGGNGAAGALNVGAQANRPDLIAVSVPPLTLAVTWDQGGRIFVSSRNDLSNSWDDVSGRPDSGAVPAIDPVMVLDGISSAPVVAWTSQDATDDILAVNNNGFSLQFPQAWVPLTAPLDIDPNNVANTPALAADDVPGAGANVGRTTFGWQEVVGGVSRVFVKQCRGTDTANCTVLGASVNAGSLNQDINADATDVSITIPNLATAALIGQSPNNPRPVAAFVEGGQLFVKRYDPAGDRWVLLRNDAINATLNAELGGVASNPSIVIDVLGRYTIVWAEIGTDGVSRVFVKRFDTQDGTGFFSSLESALNCDVNQNATAPDITVDSLGVNYVVFEEFDPVTGGNRIVAMKFED